MAPAPESPDTGPDPAATGRASAVTARRGPLTGRTEGAVELATFHRAKGLEWTAVHVVGLETGFVPIIHATTDESVAEERRLLYVALTRASQVLQCSWARSRTMGGGRTMERRPSPWLADFADCCEAGDLVPPSRDVTRRFADLRANLRR
jgi:DNA helicase-2/ATP-dependent DNA helicase PcrA